MLEQMHGIGNAVHWTLLVKASQISRRNWKTRPQWQNIWQSSIYTDSYMTIKYIHRFIYDNQVYTQIHMWQSSIYTDSILACIHIYDKYT